MLKQVERIPEILIFALLVREIWRLLGSDWQVKLFASTMTSQLPVDMGENIGIREMEDLISRFSANRSFFFFVPIRIGEGDDEAFLGAMTLVWVLEVIL